MSKIKFDCFHCSEPYYIHQSSAKEPGMFCSQQCQDQETASLTEGNKVVEDELKDNPAALAKTLRKDYGLSFAGAGDTPSQQTDIKNIVDGMFEKLNAHKRNE